MGLIDSKILSQIWATFDVSVGSASVGNSKVRRSAVLTWANDKALK
jgi:hypothetical protein